MTDNVVSPHAVPGVVPGCALIALDGGQSGSRARLLIATGTAAARRLDCALEAILTDRPVVPQLAEVAAAAVRHAWPDGAPEACALWLAVGSTGLAGTASATDLLDCVRPVGISRVALAHDSITSHVGALGGGPGAIVAAGTGVVTLAAGPAGLARVDGWGHTLGDAGSGFWIGRAGLRAVLRAYDGRGQATALSDVVTADFPILDDAYLTLQADDHWVARVAGYAKVITELAASDPVCAQIVNSAAASLANAAVTALRRAGALDAPDGPAIALLGKLFGAEELQKTVTSLVLAAVPSARFVAPLGDALDGACGLFGLAGDNPLAAQVRLAG